MVLLVPDDSDVTDGLEPEESGQPKAQLDDSEASKATQKVDLDLDDAPFLEDEDEDEEELALEEEAPPLLGEEEEEEPKLGLKALLTNKMVLIFIGIILILLAVIIFLVAKDPEPTPAPEPEPVVEEVVQEEPEPEIVEIPEILIRLDPFLIEQRGKDNKIRFLEVRVVVSTPDEGLARQFKQETYTVRNALYYYLKNKDLQFLSEEKNSDKLKKELLAIINQYMGFGQFETLLFDQYLVR